MLNPHEYRAYLSGAHQYHCQLLERREKFLGLVRANAAYEVRSMTAKSSAPRLRLCFGVISDTTSGARGAALDCFALAPPLLLLLLLPLLSCVTRLPASALSPEMMLCVRRGDERTATGSEPILRWDVCASSAGVSSSLSTTISAVLPPMPNPTNVCVCPGSTVMVFTALRRVTVFPSSSSNVRRKSNASWIHEHAQQISGTTSLETRQ
jgi:hypothetical protein